MDIIRPALLAAIATAREAWETGSRPENDKTSDENLKGRITALRWVLEWERRRETLLDDLQTAEQLARQTEPGKQGGNPYD